MKPVVLFAAWFGEPPAWFPLWWLSLKRNPDIRFVVLHDFPWEMPSVENIEPVPTTLAEVRERFSERLQEDVVLDRPYKICDFKPLYALAFPEHLKDAAFWGHIDVDVILGQIRQVIGGAIESEVDTILKRGHFKLYRNAPEINRLALESDAGVSWRHAVTTSEICFLDEYHGMLHKQVDAGTKDFNLECIADFVPGRSFLQLMNHVDYGQQAFVWEAGRLRRYYTRGPKLTDPGIQVMEEDFLYAHFQKRKFAELDFSWEAADARGFIIQSDRFLLKPPGRPTSHDLHAWNPRRSGITDPLYRQHLRKAIQRRLP